MSQIFWPGYLIAAVLQCRRTKGLSNTRVGDQGGVVVSPAPWVVAVVGLVEDAPPGSTPTTTSRALTGVVALAVAQTLEDLPTSGAPHSLAPTPHRPPHNLMARCLPRDTAHPSMVGTSRPLHPVRIHRKRPLLQFPRLSTRSPRRHRRIKGMLTHMPDMLHLLQQLQPLKWDMEGSRLMDIRQPPLKPTAMLLKHRWVMRLGSPSCRPCVPKACHALSPSVFQWSFSLVSVNLNEWKPDRLYETQLSTLYPPLCGTDQLLRRIHIFPEPVHVQPTFSSVRVVQVQAQAQAARPYAQGGAAPYAGPGPY